MLLRSKASRAFIGLAVAAALVGCGSNSLPGAQRGGAASTPGTVPGADAAEACVKPACADTADVSGWTSDSFNLGISTISLRHPPSWKRQDQQPFGHYSMVYGILATYTTGPGCQGTVSQESCGPSVLAPVGPRDVLLLIGTSGGLPNSHFQAAGGTEVTIGGHHARVVVTEPVTTATTPQDAFTGGCAQSDYQVHWSIELNGPSPWADIIGCTRGPDDLQARTDLTTAVAHATLS